MAERVPEGSRSPALRWYYANRDRVRAKKAAEYKADPKKHMAQSLRWKAANPEKARAVQKRYRDVNPQRAREGHWRRQGMCVAQAKAALAAHDGRCAICKVGVPGGTRGWCVDHCHTTGVVRGILCCGCNLRLGWYEKHEKKLKAYLLRGLA